MPMGLMFYTIVFQLLNCCNVKIVSLRNVSVGSPQNSHYLTIDSVYLNLFFIPVMWHIHRC